MQLEIDEVVVPQHLWVRAVDGDEDAKQELREYLRDVVLYSHKFSPDDTPEGNICMTVREFSRVVRIEGIKLLVGV